MATIAVLEGLIQKNAAMYQKIAQQQSLALSKIADLQFAAAGESLRRFGKVQNLQMADLGRQLAGMKDVSKAFDPAFFSVGSLIDPSTFSMAKLLDPAIFSGRAQMQGLVHAMKISAINTDVLTSVTGVLKEFKGYRFAVDPGLSTIFQDLAQGALASLQKYPFATASPEDTVLEDKAETVRDEAGDSQRVPLALTPFQMVMIAYVMALTILFLTLGDEGLSHDNMQVVLNRFSMSVLGGLTVWLVLQASNHK